jgi:hypothetical protein
VENHRWVGLHRNPTMDGCSASQKAAAPGTAMETREEVVVVVWLERDLGKTRMDIYRTQ